MNKFLLTLVVGVLIGCNKTDCPKGYGGSDCNDKLIEIYNGQYCGNLVEGGSNTQACFMVEDDVLDDSKFDIDVNVKGEFTGNGKGFIILAKDINPVKITGGSGVFDNDNLSFSVDYEVFGTKTTSTFSGNR